MEQEAFVSRIWALGAEAGHRSHEGANAHSALVDWFWLYPHPPPPLPLFLCTVFSVFSHIDHCFYRHLLSLPICSDPTSPVCVFTEKPAVLLQRGWNRSIMICMVTRIVQQVSNESLPQTNTFHKLTLPATTLSWPAEKVLRQWV